MATSVIKTFRLKRYTIIKGSVPTNSDGQWHTINHSVSFDDYQRIIIGCNVVSAGMGNSAEFDIGAFPTGSGTYSINSYWDSLNLGVLNVSNSSGSLNIEAVAKTKDFAFNYVVYGLK